MTTHTPGPWQAHRIARGSGMWDVRRVATDGPTIANVYECGASIEHNARLIAEAPNLLAVAIGVYRWIECFPTQDAETSEFRCVMREVIERATGKRVEAL